MTEQRDEGVGHPLPRGHWRRNVMYVGYYCHYCHRYVHMGLGDPHGEFCPRYVEEGGYGY